MAPGSSGEDSGEEDGGSKVMAQVSIEQTSRKVRSGRNGFAGGEAVRRWRGVAEIQRDIDLRPGRGDPFMSFSK